MKTPGQISLAQGFAKDLNKIKRDDIITYLRTIESLDKHSKRNSHRVQSQVATAYNVGGRYIIPLFEQI